MVLKIEADAEASNLLRSMAGKLNCTWHDGSYMLDTEVFVAVGNLTFQQLYSLRHRGAFSTVSLTFARCCQLTEKHSTIVNKADPNLLNSWYQVRKLAKSISTNSHSI